jgi:hypothetical protein
MGAYFSGLLDVILPSPRELTCLIQEYFREPAPGTGFTILISDLAHDPDGRQTGHVMAAFRGQHGMDVLRTCRVLEIEPYGLQAEAEAEAEKQGQQWLQDRHADLLIWGEVAEANRTLRLWFLSRGEHSLAEPKVYGLQNAELPTDFHEDYGAQIVAVALASIAPATEQAETYLVSLLRPVAAKLRRLLSDPPSNLSSEQQASAQSIFD